MGKVIACKIETTGPLKDIFKKDHLITSGQTIPVEGSSNVNFFLDETCFSDKVLSADAKWAFIYENYYSGIKDSKGKQNDLWADIGNAQNKFIEVKGIGKQYKKANNFSISPSGTSYYYGFKQRVVIFNEDAEQEFHFFIVPYLNTPSISYAYFVDSDKTRHYGDTMHLTIMLQQYPDNIRRTGNYEAKVYLLEKKDALTALTTDDFEEHNVFSKPVVKSLSFLDYKTVNCINTLIKIDFIIDIAWRKNDKGEKIFVPILELYEIKKKEFAGLVPYDSTGKPIIKNFALEPSQHLKRYNAKILGMETLQKEEDPIYSEFKVSEEAMADYLDRKEVEKNNMIQYIGDISYLKKENNPCAYSIINIEEGRRSVTIFNEYELADGVKDSTSNTFDIVAGDKEKVKVTITAKFKPDKDGKEEALHIGKNYLCESILNDGHQHEKAEDVFKMKYVVGQWKPSSDFAGRLIDRLLNFSSANSFRFYHPDNAKKAPVLKTNDPYQKKYASDQEAKGLPNPAGIADQFKVISVAEVQGLTEQDYKIEEDKITLELGYVYNKVYENRIASYLATQEAFEDGVLSKNIKNIWVVRYLLKIINREKMYQTYFVPVTTCRYPNQIAKINVYPDMKWVFNFNYNIKTPIYYRPTASLMEHYAQYNEGSVRSSNSNRRYEIRDSTINSALQVPTGRKTSFTLGVECEVSGEDEVISLSTEMGEKYRKMLSPFLMIIDKLDRDLGVTSAREESANLNTSGNRSLAARLKKLPMSFELEAPNIGLGLGIGYSGSTSGKMSYELEGRVIADPVIAAKVKLDLLALGSKIKPWGVVFDILNIASWMANFASGGNFEINYELYVSVSAKIKLVGGDSKDGEDKPATLKYNFEDKRYSGTIALQGVIEGEIVANLEFILKVERESGRMFSEVRTEEVEKKAIELGIKVEAKAWVSLTLGKSFGINNDWESDFYFSGFTMKVDIKLGANKKLKADTYNVVPGFTETINIFKNEGEYK